MGNGPKIAPRNPPREMPLTTTLLVVAMTPKVWRCARMSAIRAVLLATKSWPLSNRQRHPAMPLGEPGSTYQNRSKTSRNR